LNDTNEMEASMPNVKTRFLFLAVLAPLVLALAGGATPAAAQCPGINAIGNFKPADNGVQASFAIDGSGTIATYSFSSNNESPVAGVPGLIEYCVYPINPAGLPNDATASVNGDDGNAWQVPTIQPQKGQFSFGRKFGNENNVGLDGSTRTIGTATWNGGVPGTQTIILHINDPDECDKLYGGNPGTCFVTPGPPVGNEAQPPTVLKDANPSFDRTFAWGIGKAVDKTVVKQVGGSATFGYTVTVTHDGGTDGNWQVNGKITVTNPNPDPIKGVTVTDAVDDGGTCVVADGANVALAPGTNSFTYACTYSSAPSPLAGTNTVTATWAEQSLPGGKLATGSATYQATFDFSTTAPNVLNGCVTVGDSLAGSLGTVCSTDESPKAFTYSLSFPVPAFDCQSFANTATLTETGQSASQTVQVCGPAKTGALTMGFWQNKNGQGIVTGGASTSGVCNSGAWLRQLAPYEDLSATATCAQVAQYVTTVIKAANASGAAMNAMLKAQMLATALDVYFSDPARGGNKINAPAPVGLRSIDLTLINKPIGSASFENTSAAFGGSSCASVSDLLTSAAAQSNPGGSNWYGQVKAMQELAKDTFDAINNQVAFGCP
jgi:hypothetical protein